MLIVNLTVNKNCIYCLRPEIALKLLKTICSTIFLSKMICRLMVTFIFALRHKAGAKTRVDAHLPAVAELSSKGALSQSRRVTYMQIHSKYIEISTIHTRYPTLEATCRATCGGPITTIVVTVGPNNARFRQIRPRLNIYHQCAYDKKHGNELGDQQQFIFWYSTHINRSVEGEGIHLGFVVC